MSHSNLSPVRILVLGNGSLLDEGVGNMLSLHPRLRVTKILYTDDRTLCDLVNFERPYAVFINKFDALDIRHVLGLIFSVPSACVRCVIVVHIENSRLDVYKSPKKNAPVMAYRRKSIMVNTKGELIDLALNDICCA